MSVMIKTLGIERTNIMKKRKFLALSLAAAAVCSLTGCSITLPGWSPDTASEVIEKYADTVDGLAGYHADMDMDFEITAEAEGVNVDIPIRMEFSADVLDGGMHGDMEMSMSFMGQKLEKSIEVYVESGRRGTTAYSYDSDDGYWTVSEKDAGGAGAVLGFAELDGRDFEDAELEKDKKAGTYTVIQGFADFADSGSVYGALEDVYGSMAESMSMDPEDILDAWKDARVVYAFDKDFHLASVTVEGCEYQGTMTEDGVKADVSMCLDLAFTFSDYGKIKEKDVEVPDSVKNSAAPSITIDYDPHMTGEIDDPSFEDNDSDKTVWLPGMTEETPENPPAADVPGTPGNLPEVDGPGATWEYTAVGRATTNGWFGRYKGTLLTAHADSWDDTFGADGWEFDNDDGEYSFMTAKNAKYGDAELYVYNRARNSATRPGILEDGFYGYSIDCSYASGCPDMDWGGITFGAGAQDILDVFGEADFVYEGSMYTTYKYEIGTSHEIEFYVYPDKGLQHVSVDYWDY